MKFLKYLEEVRKMDLPLGKYAVLGSGPLAIRRVRDTKDIDLIVTPDIYAYYKKQKDWKIRFAYGNFFLRKGNLEIWKKIGFWKSRVSIRDFINRAELIDGLPFVNLHDFIYWKKKGFRDKDKEDAKLAEDWINKNLRNIKNSEEFLWPRNSRISKHLNTIFNEDSYKMLTSKIRKWIFDGYQNLKNFEARMSTLGTSYVKV